MIQEILKRLDAIKTGISKYELPQLLEEISASVIPKQYELPLLKHTPFISNCMGGTNARNTDAFLEAVLHRGDVFKIMLFYSHRNSYKVDIEAFFRYDKLLASYWWALTVCNGRSTSALADITLDHIWNHPAITTDNYALSNENSNIHDCLVWPYFACSYFRGADERRVKALINNKLQSGFKPIIGKRDDKNIAVISGHFFAGHAAYKTIAPYLASLQENYNLIGINFHDKVKMEKGFFSKVYNLKAVSVPAIFRLLEENAIGTIIYPDMGMSQGELILSQSRLAPVQIAMYGHPVSSFNPNIDYFIGGEEVEAQDAQRHYTEKLILGDGLGCSIDIPSYTPQSAASQELRIGLNWPNQKFDYQMLCDIKDAIGQTPCTIAFISVNDREGDLGALIKDMAQLFGGANVKLDFSLEGKYAEYMEYVNKCDFLVDSYPFGGFNRITDALICKKPIIALEGNQAKNRLAAALLRRFGLDELIAENEAELKEKMRKLMNAQYRQSIVDKIDINNLYKIPALDLKKCLLIP